MYITNIKHLLDASERMPEEMPEEIKGLISFLTQVIDSTTRVLPNSLTSTNVRCFEKGCDNLVKTAVRPDTEEIHWFCPNCENEGLINNWQGTKWDNSKQKNSSS